MAEDSWNFALIQQYPDDENKHWFNSLDRSNHSQHRGTYIGEWLYFIDSNYWKSHQEFTDDCPDEYARVEEVLYLEEEKVHDEIIGISWTSQKRIQLPMGETGSFGIMWQNVVIATFCQVARNGLSLR